MRRLPFPMAISTAFESLGRPGIPPPQSLIPKLNPYSSYHKSGGCVGIRARVLRVKQTFLSMFTYSCMYIDGWSTRYNDSFDFFPTPGVSSCMNEVAPSTVVFGA